MSTILERMSNIAVIVAATVMSIVLVKDFVLPRREPATAISAALQGRPLPALKLPESKAKTKIILALSARCGFCERSVPFYRTLDAVRRGAHGDMEIYAIFGEDLVQARQKLDVWGLKPDGVFAQALTPNGISGTPTVVLLNRNNLVEGVWTGQLGPDRETQVIGKLRGLCAACGPVRED